MSDSEALSLREPFFHDVTLETAEGFCFDDRFSEHELYIKVPGGIAFFANALAIARLLKHDHGVGEIGIATSRLAQEFQDFGINFGVHSDDAHDSGQFIELGGTEDDIGCAYIAKRRAVMKLISQTGHIILKQAKALRPDEFDGQEAGNLSKRIIDLNWTLASDTSFFSSTPREVAEAAIVSGAPSMVVKGKHDSNAITIINLRPNTTLDSAEAFKNGVPAYSYDAWAFREVVGRVPSLKDYDPKLLDMISMIDVLGTVDLLGSKEVYVRH